MAQDVNQSETDVAALVRSALVARISQERYELWMPADCQWRWDGAALSVRFPNDFARQVAKRIVHEDLKAALVDVVGHNIPLSLEVSDVPTQTVTAPSISAPVNWDTSAPSATTSVQGESASPSVPANKDTVTTERPVTNRRPSRSNQTKERSAEPTSNVDQRETASGEDAQVIRGNFGGARERDGQIAVESADRISEVKSVRPAGDQWREFVRGSSNQMAWTSIDLIANEPGSMTPALLHGPYGVGKSHLGSALAQRLRMQKRQRRVLHITAEQFTNDFTEAIRGSGLPMMRRKYRDVDTLILDDLQFLIGKKATIGELRQTLDNLLKAGRQVVFLADRPLSELDGLGSDFIGRLRGGLVSHLLPLDEETRYQILKRDLAAVGVELSDEIVLQIAARAIGDGRLLKGIVKRLRATAYLAERGLGWDDCWNAIYDLVQATQPIVRLGDIERVVCEVFGLEPNSLQSDRKTRQVSQPRMLAMFLARKYTPAAYQEIGEYFGNRRHSTVISAEKTVGAWLEENAALQAPRGSLSIREAVRHVEAHLHVG